MAALDSKLACRRFKTYADYSATGVLRAAAAAPSRVNLTY